MCRASTGVHSAKKSILFSLCLSDSEIHQHHFICTGSERTHSRVCVCVCGGGRGEGVVCACGGNGSGFVCVKACVCACLFQFLKVCYVRYMCVCQCLLSYLFHLLFFSFPYFFTAKYSDALLSCLSEFERSLLVRDSTLLLRLCVFGRGQGELKGAGGGGGNQIMTHACPSFARKNTTVLITTLCADSSLLVFLF